ncbi:MAG: sigma-70 family RNA polymerase sigma factor [Polyangiaceae bacterium]|nr:sigma-70 family RNA polymerase sigma factor [Polyangiaceae bacterium]
MSPGAPAVPLPGSPSADDLLARAAAGDRAAWQALVAIHDRRVIVSLLARGIPLDRARDLAQETWARLWEQHQQGKLPRLELPGLAVRQAAFLAVDEARRRARARTAELEDAADVVDGAAPTDESLASKEQVARALTALEQLSPRARQIFTEVYESPHRPHAESAERLGLSVQRLRQTLCEVRARLRAAMEDDHG